MSIDWVLYDTDFHRRVFRNRLEHTLFPQKTELFVIIPIVLNIRSHSPLTMLLVTECIKRVYSKHSKNAKSRSYLTYSSLGKKMLLGISTCNGKSINILHKSDFGNQNFA